MRNILLLTEHNDFFGQTRKAWVPMDAEKLHHEILQYGLDVEKMPFHQLINSKEQPKDKIILYAFSQKVNVRRYILDTVNFLSHENVVIPSIDLLLCHEDKGYQELFKRKIGIHSLDSFYFSEPEEIEDFHVEYPVVLKAVDGSNGKQVFLVHSDKEMKKLIEKNFVNLKFSDKVDYFRRKHFRKYKEKYYPQHSDKLDAEQWKRYVTQHRSFIIQEYVPDLVFDYRVLAMHGKYYVVKRHNRDDDFRASGAKKFDFDFTPADEMLDYAKSIFNKADSPILSIDICEKDGRFYLLEFQALHFGLNVFIKGSGYWSESENGWQFQKEEPVIEREVARSFAEYIQAKGF